MFLGNSYIKNLKNEQRNYWESLTTSYNYIVLLEKMSTAYA